MTQEIAFLARGILGLICIGLGIYYAFRHTPELDGVKNATFYRLSFALLIIRGMLFSIDTFLPFPEG